MYDFFDLLINENKVKEIINKYFYAIIKIRISLNLNINELINFIKESSCFKNNKFDLYKLYEYIDLKRKNNLSKKENENINKQKRKDIKKKKKKYFRKK